MPALITPDVALELASLGDMLRVHRTRCNGTCRDGRRIAAEIDALLDRALTGTHAPETLEPPAHGRAGWSTRR